MLTLKVVKRHTKIISLLLLSFCLNDTLMSILNFYFKILIQKRCLWLYLIQVCFLGAVNFLPVLFVNFFQLRRKKERIDWQIVYSVTTWWKKRVRGIALVVRRVNFYFEVNRGPKNLYSTRQQFYVEAVLCPVVVVCNNIISSEL